MKLNQIKTVLSTNFKTISLIFLTVFATSSCNTAATAIDFQITLFENNNHTAGEVFHLTDYAGQPVVINFWFPSCPPCVAEVPDLEKAFQKYSDQGVQFIGIQAIGLDSIEDGQNFVSNFNLNYALGPDIDSSTIKAYGVRGFPSTFFLNSEHKVARRWEGLLNFDTLDEVIPQLLN